MRRFLTALLLDQFLAFLKADLPNSVRFTRRSALVALDIVARQENAVTRDNFTGFQKCDIANDDLLE